MKHVDSLTLTQGDGSIQRRAAHWRHRDAGTGRLWILMLAVSVLIAWLAGTRVALAAEDRPVRSLLEMRQDGVVVQEWDLSCGAAALATILNYQHGDFVAEKEIAQALIKRKEYIENPLLVRVRHGFSLLDLKRYVDGRGYEGVGYGRLSMEDLIQHAPIIVPINVGGYNHFVVFRGVLGDRVLLADPAWGNRTMRAAQFEEAWIEFPQFGRVGFVVTRSDGSSPSQHRLLPRADDFVMLR